MLRAPRPLAAPSLCPPGAAPALVGEPAKLNARHPVVTAPGCRALLTLLQIQFQPSICTCTACNPLLSLPAPCCTTHGDNPLRKSQVGQRDALVAALLMCWSRQWIGNPTLRQECTGQQLTVVLPSPQLSLSQWPMGTAHILTPLPAFAWGRRAWRHAHPHSLTHPSLACNFEGGRAAQPPISTFEPLPEQTAPGVTCDM
jgi:hypothetical protein